MSTGLHSQSCWLSPLPGLTNIENIHEAIDVYRVLGEEKEGRIITRQTENMYDDYTVVVQRGDLYSEREIATVDSEEEVDKIVKETAWKLVSA